VSVCGPRTSRSAGASGTPFFKISTSDDGIGRPSLLSMGALSMAMRFPKAKSAEEMIFLRGSGKVKINYDGRVQVLAPAGSDAIGLASIAHRSPP
jgi:hypothetical protein